VTCRIFVGLATGTTVAARRPNDSAVIPNGTAQIADSQGVGTITDDEKKPRK
jgi:hypothetical protein